jgi:MFS family permease
MAAYASFGLAFVARPVGAAVFGHFGDRIGRKSTLVASLLIMGSSTVAIGLLPIYDQVGWLAPLLLCVLRFGQGFGLGGEWGGAVLLAVENAPPGWHARFGMVPQLGAPLGFIIANGLYLLLGLWLTPAAFQAWGWRLPFLASLVLVALGLWIRLRLSETPAFIAAMKAAPPSRVPLAELLRRYPRQTIGSTFAVVACFAIFYLSTAFALGYGTTILGLARTRFLEIQLLAILFMAIGIIVSGALADRHDPRRVLMGGCIGTIGLAFLLAPMLGSASLLIVFLFLSLALLLMGFVYGPLGAFLPALFPPRVRYTGATVAFNIGGIFGGALAPILAQSLAERGGLAFVGVYLGAAAIISLIALLPFRRG